MGAVRAAEVLSREARSASMAATGTGSGRASPLPFLEAGEQPPAAVAGALAAAKGQAASRHTRAAAVVRRAMRSPDAA
ncbi:hypothetical protein GCM10010412_071420 [Nonomuraea recticatena]|uniref:Uncharacterized protein n=1 Tax=Nonomuraea recticatena TaxID=46178 RepID=A0ABN3ST85_9ACTN